MNKYRRETLVDIVVVGWEHIDTTLRCFDSVVANTPPDLYNIIYVDNGSDIDNLRELERKHPQVTYVRLPFNNGYVRACNIGLSMSVMNTSKYVMTLNNDTRIQQGDYQWLERMVWCIENYKHIGAIGAVSDKVFGNQTREKASAENILTGTGALVGFCMLINKEALQQIGLMDEQFEPGNWDDFDFSARLIDAGWGIGVAEGVWIHHDMHTTTGSLNSELLAVNRRKFFGKWPPEKLRALGISIR